MLLPTVPHTGLGRKKETFALGPLSQLAEILIRCIDVIHRTDFVLYNTSLWKEEEVKREKATDRILLYTRTHGENAKQKERI